MKTIICNNCVAGKIYELLNAQFDNPFIWQCMSDEEYLNLVRNFDSINFNNINIQINNSQQYKDTIIITIDARYNLFFIHHHNDNSFTVPTKSKFTGKYGVRDLYYNNMKEYINKAYQRRLQRMNKNNLLFLFINRDSRNYSVDFQNIKTGCLKVLVANDDLASTDDTFFIKDKLGLPTGRIAERILNKNKEIFLG